MNFSSNYNYIDDNFFQSSTMVRYKSFHFYINNNNTYNVHILTLYQHDLSMFRDWCCLVLMYTLQGIDSLKTVRIGIMIRLWNTSLKADVDS